MSDGFWTEKRRNALRETLAACFANGLVQAEFRRRYAQFGTREDERQNYADLGYGKPEGKYELTAPQLTQFMKGTTQKLRNVEHFNRIHAYLVTHYPDDLAAHFDRPANSDVQAFVAGARAVFGRGPARPEALTNLRGEFELYRPHYLEPDKQVMKCRFRIGDVHGAHNCRLEMRYPDPGGDTAHVVLTGQMVTLGRRAFCLMTVLRDDGSFYNDGFYCLFIDTVETNGPPHIMRFAGTMLASRDARRAGAYPFYAARRTGDFAVETVPVGDWMPKAVRDRFSLGAVLHEDIR